VLVGHALRAPTRRGDYQDKGAHLEGLSFLDGRGQPGYRFPIEVLTTTTGAVFAVVLGLLWGSFANVCIYRWPPTDDQPKGRSVVTPGSHCFACQAPIRWYDNVPLLSYLWLRGRCRACKAQFSPRYLIGEALTGALFGVA